MRKRRRPLQSRLSISAAPIPQQNLPTAEQPLVQAARFAQSEAAAPTVTQQFVEKFDQEKRMLLTRAESMALDRLIAWLAVRFNAQVKLSTFFAPLSHSFLTPKTNSKRGQRRQSASFALQTATQRPYSVSSGKSRASSPRPSVMRGRSGKGWFSRIVAGGMFVVRLAVCLSSPLRVRRKLPIAQRRHAEKALQYSNSLLAAR